MTTEEQELFVLKWLAYDPNAKFFTTTAKIVAALSTSNELLSEKKLLEDKWGGKMTFEVNMVALKEETQFILDLLKKKELITSSEFEVYLDRRKVIETNYSITKKGRAHLKKIILDGQMSYDDFRSLDAALEFINLYGAVDLKKISAILLEMDILLNETVIRSFLIENGFCSVQHIIHGEQALILLHLTERGRKLKISGSYSELMHQEDDDEGREKARQDLSDRLLESNLSSANLQHAQVNINRWIAIGTAIGSIYAAVQITQSVGSISMEKKSSLIILIFGIALGGVVLLAFQAISRKEK